MVGNRLRVAVLATMGIQAGLAPSVLAQDPGKGAALLAEARRAIGGEERLLGVKTLDVRGAFKRAAGQFNMGGELQIRIERPDKLRRDEDLSPPGGGPAVVRTEVLNGTEVWEENSGRGAFITRFGRGGDAGRGGPDGGGRAAADPARIQELQRTARQAELARLMLAWLLAADGSVTWVGTAEAPDGKADVLEVTPAAGPALRLFLDASTHVPLMITWRGVAPQMVFAGRRGGRGARGDGAPPEGAPRPDGPRPDRPPDATLRMTLGGYKTVNGIKLPHLVTRGFNDTTVEEWVVESYRINPSFRGDVFAQ